MAVEEVFVPVSAVGCVGKLRVEAHYRREDLGEKKNEETGEEGWGRGRGCGRGIFALYIGGEKDSCDY